MKSWIIFAAILIIAALTNPGIDKHTEAVKEKVEQEVNKDGNTDLGSVIGHSLGSLLIESVIGQVVSVDNYLIFSLTRITFDGDSKIIGVGLFGNVIITADMFKKLDSALNLE